MIIHVINYCLGCDFVKIPFNKMFCSVKCFNQSKNICEEQNGKGSFGFDSSDIWKKPELHKRIKIKKKTEAQIVKEQGKY